MAGLLPRDSTRMAEAWQPLPGGDGGNPTTLPLSSADDPSRSSWSALFSQGCCYDTIPLPRPMYGPSFDAAGVCSELHKANEQSPLSERLDELSRPEDTVD